MLAALAATMCGATTAKAEKVAALLDGNTIAIVDTDTKKAGKAMTITGLSGSSGSTSGRPTTCFTGWWMMEPLSPSRWTARPP